MTQTATQLRYVSDWKTRTVARLATYKQSVAQYEGEDAAALLHSIETASQVIEGAYESCDGSKADIDNFYDTTFEQVENVTLAYAKIVDSRQATKAQPRLNVPGGQIEAASTSITYVIHTSQEIDIWERAVCDGRINKNWRNEEQRQARVYELKGESHRVELSLSEADHGLSLADLEKLTLSQDADCVLTMLYICSVLASPSPLPPNRYAGGWIDLDDVMQKIGWYPTKFSKAEAAEKRARLWQYLVYGDRAAVMGERTIPYRDKHTGEVIETAVFSPIWRIHGVKNPLQRTLFNEVPLSVEIVIGKEWERLLTLPNLAQYLPLGELLGNIPPGKVAGDWARCIGLVLAHLWRCKPRETARGTLNPTRRELLTRYTPKTRTVGELLDGDKPRRAVGYWREALGILAEAGFIARSGEATQTTAPTGYNWQDAWLDERVKLTPGPKAEALVIERAEALPPLQPKALPTKKRRGRPPKKTLE